jgi:hypothetical protein
MLGLNEVKEVNTTEGVACHGQREEAARVRSWFDKDFLNALVD